MDKQVKIIHYIEVELEIINTYMPRLKKNFVEGIENLDGSIQRLSELLDLAKEVAGLNSKRDEQI